MSKINGIHVSNESRLRPKIVGKHYKEFNRTSKYLFVTDKELLIGIEQALNLYFHGEIDTSIKDNLKNEILDFFEERALESYTFYDGGHFKRICKRFNLKCRLDILLKIYPNGTFKIT